MTATLATFFVGRDARHSDAGLPEVSQLAGLRAEVIGLREEIRTLTVRGRGESLGGRAA